MHTVLIIGYVALALAIAFLLLLAIGLQIEVRVLNNKVRRGSSRLALNSLAPRFSGADIRDDSIKISSRVLSGEPYLILFVSATCPTCRRLLADLELTDYRDLLVVCTGPREQCKTLLSTITGPTRGAVHDSDGTLSEDFGALSFPTVVFVDAHSKIKAYIQPKKASEVLEFAGIHIADIKLP